MPIDRLICTSAIVLLLGGCAGSGQDTTQTPALGAHAQGTDRGRPVLYDTLGSYSHRFWGIAITEGSSYNDPTNADREKKAAAAVQEASPLSAGASPSEPALIQALAKRHSADAAATRETLDRAYADAMREVARQFPDDLEAATFFADSMTNLRPWNLWTPDGAPQPGTEEIVATLERVIAKSPDHPGALHLYIHAVEASRDPRRAEAAADRLRPLMPGAGHLVHMPAHIYMRVGRHGDSVATNVGTVDGDRAYFKTATPSPIYRGLYYPHNIDFNWQSAAMQGCSAETVRAAREFASNAPAEVITQMPDMETAPVAPIVALVRFGRWDEALARPAPPREWSYTSGVWHYARGTAFNAKGQAADAARAARAVWARQEPARAGQDGRGGSDRRELQEGVGAGRRDVDRVPILATG